MGEAAIAKEMAERKRVLKEAHDAFQKTRSVADGLNCVHVMQGVMLKDMAELGEIVRLMGLRLSAVEAFLEQATAANPDPTN